MSPRARGSTGGSTGRRRGTGRRLLIAAGIVAALVFAVQGGEYSTLDLLRQRNREARLRAEIDSLSRMVDSLERYRRRLETDPVLQEQIAREEFGMVRGDREILYRFAEPAPESLSRAKRGSVRESGRGAP